MLEKVNMAGKGSKYRPVNGKKYRGNYDRIFKQSNSDRDRVATENKNKSA